MAEGVIERRIREREIVYHERRKARKGSGLEVRQAVLLNLSLMPEAWLVDVRDCESRVNYGVPIWTTQ